MGSGLPALLLLRVSGVGGGGGKGASASSTGVPAEDGVPRFGRSAPPSGPYGSSSSTMQRCTRRRAPSYPTTTSPVKSRPVTESFMGSDMNIGEG